MSSTNQTRDPWNRCVYCGKFISYADFASTKAVRWLITPDAEGTQETYGTMCKKCNHNDFR